MALLLTFMAHGYFALPAQEKTCPWGNDIKEPLESFQSRPASFKMEAIWGNVVDSLPVSQEEMTYEHDVKYIQAIGHPTVCPFFNQSFDATADEFGPNSTRQKVVHRVGVVAKVAYESVGNHPYTGVFKSGSGKTDAIIRTGFGGTSDPGAPQNRSNSQAIKIFRNGRESANLLLMTDFIGHSNWNYFEAVESTHVIDLPQGVKDLIKNFQESSPYASRVGTYQVAKYDADGVESKNPKFPYRLFFTPNQKFAKLFPRTKEEMEKSGLCDNGFSRDPFGVQCYMSLPGWKQIPVGSVIMNVVAQEEPTDTADKFQIIGKIILKSQYSQNLYGDAKLFFRHNRMEDDEELRPEWRPFLQKESANGDAESFQFLRDVYFRE
jgi:hypothetical protein